MTSQNIILVISGVFWNVTRGELLLHTNVLLSRNDFDTTVQTVNCQ